MIYYSIHGIINIKTGEEIPVLSGFRTKKKPAELDIEILRRDLTFVRPKGHEMLRRDHYVWTKKSTLFIDYNFLKTKFLIDDLMGKTRIACTRNFRRFCTDEGWNQFIMALLSIKLIQKNYTLIHSGGVSCPDGRVVLIAGLPDTGKTSTILSLSDGEKSKFMGDDWIIVGENRLAYSFPIGMGVKVSPLTLTGKLTPAHGTLEKKLLKSPLASIFMEKLLRKETAKWKKVPDEWVGDKGAIKKVFLIKGYGQREVKRRISKNQAVNAVYLTSMEAALTSHRYVNLYLYSFGIDFFDLLKRKREILEKALKDAECYELAAPSIEKYPRLIRRTLENERH